MSKDLSLIIKFDTFIRKSLKNEVINFVKSEKTQQKKYVNFSELSKSEENELFAFDEYPSEKFEESLSTQLFDAIIHNELLYEALLSIKPNSRELILLKYWGDMTDYEVGQVMNMSEQTVNKHKLRTLEKLRTFMEGTNYDK